MAAPEALACTREMIIGDMSAHRTVESFVARIWLEGEPDGDPIWRGRIQHVQSNQEAYFQDLTEMSAFMERVARIPGPKPTGRPPPSAAVVTRKPKD
ncbi:MAG: hypothetical protein KAR22_04270 [Gammaproteobacteria bacterium]|nr:hypothetical protein [Gammaproteobacteria bacterium]